MFRLFFVILATALMCGPLVGQLQASCSAQIAQMEAHKIWIRKRSPKPINQDEFLIEHHWKVAGAPREEGRAEFIEDLYLNKVLITIYRGVKEKAGVGSYLIDQIRKAFPDKDLIGDLGHINFNRARQAFLENPQAPDLQIIPLFKNMSGLVEFGPRMDTFDRVEGAPIHFEIKALSKTPSQLNDTKWLNEDELISHPEYRHWIEYLEGESEE